MKIWPHSPVGGKLLVYPNSTLACTLARKNGHSTVRGMRDLIILAIHLAVTFARLLCSGGIRAVAAESAALKHHILISNRSRRRAPNLTTLDRVVPGADHRVREPAPYCEAPRGHKAGHVIQISHGGCRVRSE